MERLSGIPPSVPASEAVMMPPAKREWLWVGCLLTALVGFQLLTHRLYPVAWCDEVSFSEPAINLIQHGSFTTTVWQHQPPDTFPAINCPLYSMLLAPWLWFAGTSLLAVRSLNFVLMGVAGFLVWMLSWRYGLVRRSAGRLLLPILLFSGYGMSFAYRCSRPDVLALVCLLLLALSLGLRRRWVRTGAVMALGAVIVWVGLQVALYAALLGAGAWALLRVVSLRMLAALAAGFALGVLSLALFLQAHGVLEYLLPIITGMSGKHYAHDATFSFGSALTRIATKTLFAYPDDFSTLVLAGATAGFLVVGGRRMEPGRRFGVLVSLALILAVPLVFNIVGHYAFYYSYMLYLPAVAGFAVLTAPMLETPRAWPFWMRCGALAAFLGAVAVGLPLRLALNTAFARFDDPAQVRQLISAHLSPSDVVFTDYLMFFEVKQVAGRVYDPWSSSETLPFHLPGRAFTPKEKAEVTALVVRPEQLASYAQVFGGHWAASGPPFGDWNDRESMRRVPVVGNWLVRHLTQPQTDRYRVQIFRRAAEPEAGP
jgi:hypothetical protein